MVTTVVMLNMVALFGALMFVCTLSTALWGVFLYFFFSTVIALRGSSYRLGETML